MRKQVTTGKARCQVYSIRIFRIVNIGKGPNLIVEMSVILKRREVTVALSALVVGVVIYLTERSGAGVYLLPDGWEAVLPVSLLGNHLPSFLHAFAFVILTAIVLEPWRGAVIFSCLLWAAVNTLFELGQIDAVGRDDRSIYPALVRRLAASREPRQLLFERHI